MHEGGRDGCDAGDGDDEPAVALDPLDHADGALEWAVEHPDLLALEELPVADFEGMELLVLEAQHHAEILHFTVGDGLWVLPHRVPVHHQLREPVLLRLDDVAFRAADEHDRSEQGLASGHRDIGLDALACKVSFEAGSIRVYLHGVPADGW